MVVEKKYVQSDIPTNIGIEDGFGKIDLVEFKF